MQVTEQLHTGARVVARADLVVACDDGDCLWQRVSSVAQGLCDGVHSYIVVAGMWCCVLVF